MRDLPSSVNLDKAARFLWAAALLTLPVTSFRYFPFLGETTYVRPLALYPLALLMLLLFMRLLRGAISLPWPGTLIPLGAFTLAALAATALGASFAPLSLRGQEYGDRAIRAWATLVVGLVFFLAATWMNRNESDLRFTLKWLLAGLGVDILWSGVQALAFHTPLLAKETVTHWQLVFSVRELVRTNRISGLAYEPAWLAGQLATLYLPWLFAALLTGSRITRAKWLEPALLGLSLLLLLATYSRGGILITFGAAGLALLLIGRKPLRGAWDWFLSGLRGRARDRLLRLGSVAAAAILLIGAFAFLGQKNYFRRLWEISAESIAEYIIDINAGARSAYAVGALAAFEQHPWTGVGLGASGFHIYDNLPHWALTTVPEIARQLSPESRLFPNPKNMYVRLLAETGLIGFVLFAAFQLSLLGDVLIALRRAGLRRFLGVAGLFAWLAIGLYNFTQDSLATPNIWLIPGILAGIVAQETTPLQEKVSA